MAEQNWYLNEVLAKSNANRRSPDMIWANEKYGTPTSKGPKAKSIQDALLEQNIYSNPESAVAEQARTAARERVAPARTERQTKLFPKQTPTPPGGGGGSGLNDIFAPLFAALDQQKKNAESRYTENSGQIKNIYGQLIGARTADVDSIDTAYKRLQEAAATRGEATISGMAGREAERVSQNQAVLQSMGVGEIGTAAGDIAATSSQAAQDTAALNQENWAGLLGAMGATAQETARADATGFGYRQGEDIARLQGSKEDYLQNIAQQEFGLQSEQAQAEQQYRQAQAAAAATAANAAANATNSANAAAAKRAQELLKYADPLTQATARGVELGLLDSAGVSAVRAAYLDWMANNGTNPTGAGVQSWNKGNATADAIKTVGAQLTNEQKSALIEAISNSF